MGFVVRIKNSLFWKALLRIQVVLLFCLSLSVLAVIGLVVLMRYVFHSDIFAFDEIVLILAYWMYFLGSAYALYEGTHVKADILENLLSERAKRGLRVLVGLIQVGLGVIYIAWAWEMIVYSWTEMPRTSAWGIPIALPQTSIFIGFVLMTFYSVVYCLEDFFSFFDSSDHLEVAAPRAEAEKPILASAEEGAAPVPMKTLEG